MPAATSTYQVPQASTVTAPAGGPPPGLEDWAQPTYDAPAQGANGNGTNGNGAAAPTAAVTYPPTQGYTPPAPPMQPTTVPPQGFPPQGFPPQGFAPPPTQQLPPQGFAPARAAWTAPAAQQKTRTSLPLGVLRAGGFIGVASGLAACLALAMNHLGSSAAMRVELLLPALGLIIGGLLTLASTDLAAFGGGLVVGAGAAFGATLPAFLQGYRGDGEVEGVVHVLTGASALGAIAALVALVAFCGDRERRADGSTALGIIGGVCAMAVMLLPAFATIKGGHGVLDSSDGFAKAAYVCGLVAGGAVLCVTAIASSGAGRGGALLGFAAAIAAHYVIVAIVGVPADQLAPAFWAGILLLVFAVIAGLTVATMAALQRSGAIAGFAFGFVAVALLTAVLAGQSSIGVNLNTGGLLSSSGSGSGSSSGTGSSSGFNSGNSSSSSGSSSYDDSSTGDGYNRGPSVSSGSSSTGNVSASGYPSAVSESERRNIQSVLLEFHQDLVSGNYQSAWDLMSVRKQQQSRNEMGYDKWVTNSATLGKYLSPNWLSVTVQDYDRTTGEARVYLGGMGWSQPNSTCREWSGITWVKYENGVWRYDPGYSTTPERSAIWKNRVSELLGGQCSTRS